LKYAKTYIEAMENGIRQKVTGIKLPKKTLKGALKQINEIDALIKNK
jgi:hypothetical protein